jgi:hypothetical protein
MQRSLYDLLVMARMTLVTDLIQHRWAWEPERGTCFNADCFERSETTFNRRDRSPFARTWPD